MTAAIYKKHLDHIYKLFIRNNNELNKYLLCFFKLFKKQNKTLFIENKTKK